ncbi:hypothetical protein HPL003_06675 [Paenibacillus terrae HPL-003]|uniref:Uncharacterized protein n=1 Tax=Paenibacillus terrae (strain HPL-003) TaxID=985665 RepID=G7W3L1_PAETH|nr:hypothetical protein [Paenibacillus terrae]AET58098.1 hypothetical protein HPL003_06675 [Paenibacillus terrae HPL-003]
MIINKRKINIIAIILVVLVIGIPSIIYLSGLNTSFQKVVLDRINVGDITSLYIIKDSSNGDIKDAVVTDKEVIKKIMNEFTNVKFKKSDSITSLNDNYTIRIRVKEESRFMITIWSNTDITIFDKEAKYSAYNYKVTSKFDYESLDKYLKKLLD